MKINVKLFAVVREIARASELSVDLPAGSPAASVLESLLRSYPLLRPYEGYLRIAVNNDYVDGAHLLHENDEVAVIPPVSGG